LPAASRRWPPARRRCTGRGLPWSKSRASTTETKLSVSRVDCDQKERWGGPVRTPASSFAAAGLLARGRIRYGAPKGAWLGAFEATEHGESKGQSSGVNGLTAARRRRARRLGTPASMAARDRGGEGSRGLRGNAHQTLVNTLEQASEAGKLRRRRIDQLELRRPATIR
jgi:hypothetical protein